MIDEPPARRKPLGAPVALLTHRGRRRSRHTRQRAERALVGGQPAWQACSARRAPPLRPRDGQACMVSRLEMTHEALPYRSLGLVGIRPAAPDHRTQRVGRQRARQNEHVAIQPRLVHGTGRGRGGGGGRGGGQTHRIGCRSRSRRRVRSRVVRAVHLEVCASRPSECRSGSCSSKSSRQVAAQAQAQYHGRNYQSKIYAKSLVKWSKIKEIKLIRTDTTL